MSSLNEYKTQSESESDSDSVSSVEPTQILYQTESSDSEDITVPVAPGRSKRPRSDSPIRRNAEPTPPRSRNWCFTINNPIIGGPAFLTVLKSLSHFRSCIFQLERGESGTPHFQGYIQFHQQKSFTFMAHALPGSHLEIARGSPEQNRSYCSKSTCRIEGPWQEGDFVTERQRTDLIKCCEILKGGGSLADVAENYPATFVRNAGGLYKYLRCLPPPPMQRPHVVELWIGTTGLGKTTTAAEQYPGAYLKGPDLWWEHYQGQKTVIWDDFSGAASKVTLSAMLRFLDVFRIYVETKGASEWLRSEHTIITTNLHPLTWYDYSKRHSQYDALVRRFDCVRIFLGLGTYIDKLSPHDIKQWCNNPEAAGLFIDPVVASPVKREVIDLTEF